MKEILRRQNSSAIYHHVLPASLIEVSFSNFQRWMNQELSELKWGRIIDQKWSQCKGRLVRPP
jgi:hypothetical protein